MDRIHRKPIGKVRRRKATVAEVKERGDDGHEPGKMQLVELVVVTFEREIIFLSNQWERVLRMTSPVQACSSSSSNIEF